MTEFSYTSEQAVNELVEQNKRKAAAKKKAAAKSHMSDGQLTIDYNGGWNTTSLTPDKYALRQPYTTTTSGGTGASTITLGGVGNSTITMADIKSTSVVTNRGTAAIQALHDVLKALREADSYSDQMCEDCAQGTEWIDREATYELIKNLIKKSGAIDL